jgi:hypothetical protein
VADQWDEGGKCASRQLGVDPDPADHAQWDIKLGEDANMRSISAKFGGNDLKITGKYDPANPGGRY